MIWEKKLTHWKKRGAGGRKNSTWFEKYNTPLCFNDFPK